VKNGSSLKSIQLVSSPHSQKKPQSQIGISGKKSFKCWLCCNAVSTRSLVIHINVKKDDKFKRMSGEGRGRYHSTVKVRELGAFTSVRILLGCYTRSATHMAVLHPCLITLDRALWNGAFCASISTAIS
jgi:hypothetical protein